MIGGRSQAPPRARPATAAGRAARPTGPARRRRRRRRPGPSPGLLIALLVVLAVLAGGFLWLRQSSLVAVRHVTITGVSGPDAPQIRSSLTRAARTMTTLDVRSAALHNAVVPFPVVKHIRVSTSFPHGMRIAVVEQAPIAELTAGGQHVAIAGDGTLLRDAPASGSLPVISLPVAPGGTHLTGNGLAEARLLAAAPYELIAHIQSVSSDASNGFYAQLRNGPKIIFGAASDLDAKWSAAVAVLAAPTSDGAGYIDVSDPARPAAGNGSAPGASSASGASASGASASGASASGASASGASASTVSTAAPALSTGASSTAAPAAVAGNTGG